MRTVKLIACMLFLPLFAGCAMSDALFAVFGDHYSEGGYTREEKQYHYNQQIEASRNYGSQIP